MLTVLENVWTLETYIVKKSVGCIAANGSKMSSSGIFEIKMTIRGQKFTHPVTVVEDLNDNILGRDFMHQHKMNNDSTSKQITFAHMLTLCSERSDNSSTIIHDGYHKIQRSYQ
jgi:hypothetical protein